MTGTPQPGSRPFVTGPQEGQALWSLDGLRQVKAPAPATGGQISVTELVLPEASSPPLHVHHREDEAFYVLEGQLTCRAGDQVLTATAGSFVWLPRDLPHTFRVDSPTARILSLCVPGGFEEFFAAIGRPAAQLTLPPAPEEPPDMEALVGHARPYAVEFLGPPMT
jgi:quercetin dioxygenase-like cupin family protein